MSDRPIQSNIYRTTDHQPCHEKLVHTYREPRRIGPISVRATLRSFASSSPRETEKNRISYLQNTDGTHATTPDQLAHTLQTYFWNIFSSEPHHQISNDIGSTDDHSIAEQANAGEEHYATPTQCHRYKNFIALSKTWEAMPPLDLMDSMQHSTNRLGLG